MRSEINILASELSSPLATSKSALAMVLDGDFGELNEKQREYITSAMQLNDYAITLLQTWADMERLRQGGVVLAPEPLNVGLVISEFMTVQRRTHWPMVLADRIRLRQIVAYCIETIDPQDVRARITQDLCVITFHNPLDLGGARRSAILDGLQGRRPRGNLGLRIARLLAEAHGGGIHLNPHASQGLRLHVTLPLATQMSLLGE